MDGPHELSDGDSTHLKTLHSENNRSDIETTTVGDQHLKASAQNLTETTEEDQTAQNLTVRMSVNDGQLTPSEVLSDSMLKLILDKLDRIESRQQQVPCYDPRSERNFIYKRPIGAADGAPEIDPDPMNETKKLFDRLLVRMVDVLEVRHLFLSFFISKGLITHEIKEEILGKETCCAKVSHLIGFLRVRGLEAVECLKLALKGTAQEHLLKEIEECQQTDEERHDKVTGLQKEVEILKTNKKLFNKQITQMKDKMKDSEEKIYSLQSKVEHMLKESLHQEEEMQSRVRELETLQDTEADGQEEVQSRNRKISQLEKDIEELRAEKAGLDKKMEKLQTEEKAEKDHRHALEEQIQQKAEKMTAMDENLANKQMKIEDLQSELWEKDSVIDLLMVEVERAKKDKCNMDSVIDKLKETISDQQFTIKAKDLELRDMEARIGMKNDELTEISRARDLLNKAFQELRERCNTNENEIDTLIIQAKEFSEKMEAKNAELAELMSEELDLKGKSQDLQEVKERQEMQIIDLAQQITAMEEEHNQIILKKTSEFDELTQSFDEHQESSRTKIESLTETVAIKEKEIDSQTFLVSELESICASRDEKLSELKSEIEKVTMEKQELKQPLDAKIEELQILVHEKEKVIDLLMAGMGKETQEKLSHEKEIAGIRQKVKSQEEEMNKAEILKAELKSEVAKLRETEGEQARKISDIQEQVRQLQSSLRETERQVAERNRTIDKLERDIIDHKENLKRERAEAKEDLSKAQKGLSSKQFMLDELDSVCSTKNEETKRLTSEMKKLQEESSKQVALLEDKVKRKEDEFLVISKEVSQQHSSINKISVQFTDLQKLHTEEQETNKSLQRKVKELEDVARKMKDEVCQALSAKENETCDVAELQKTKRSQQGEILTLQEKNKNLESSMAARDSILQEVFNSSTPGEPEVLSYHPPFTSLTLSWSPPLTNLHHLTGYELHYQENKPGSSPQTCRVPLPDAESYKLCDLIPHRVYSMKVCSLLKGDQKSAFGPSVLVRTSPPPPAPERPEQLAAKTTHDCIAIKCSATKAISSYKLQRFRIRFRVAGEGSWTIVPTSPHEDGDFIIGGLKPAMQYEVRVCGEYEEGIRSGYSESALMSTRPTTPPAKPTCDSQDARTFRWSPPECVGEGVKVDHYVLRRVALTGRSWGEMSVKVTGTCHTYNTVLTVPHQVTVRAVCGSGSPEVKYQSLDSDIYYHVT